MVALAFWIELGVATCRTFSHQFFARHRLYKPCHHPPRGSCRPLLVSLKNLDRIFAPGDLPLYPVPKSFSVLVQLFLGIGDLAKIVIIYMILFFQILVLVRDQAVSLRPELIESVRSLGAGRRALFEFVYLPASLPAILTAVRQSIGTAVAVLYITELFATQKGLGYYIYLNGSTLFNYPAMYGGNRHEHAWLFLYYAASLKMADPRLPGISQGLISR